MIIIETNKAAERERERVVWFGYELCFFAYMVRPSTVAVLVIVFVDAAGSDVLDLWSGDTEEKERETGGTVVSSSPQQQKKISF
jgi:hypothetical protein